MLKKNSFGEKLAHKIRKCPRLAASLYCFTLVAFNDDYFFTFPSKISNGGLAQIHIVCRVPGKGTRKNICCFCVRLYWLYTAVHRKDLQDECTQVSDYECIYFALSYMDTVQYVVVSCKPFFWHSPFSFFLGGLPILSANCCCVQSSALCVYCAL
jgi:hypothetical protein